MRLFALLLIALALGPWWSADAQGGTITLIAPGGIRAPIEQPIPGFERQTGYFDVPIVQPPCPDVPASGNVVADSATTLALVPRKRCWRILVRRPPQRCTGHAEWSREASRQRAPPTFAISRKTEAQRRSSTDMATSRKMPRSVPGRRGAEPWTGTVVVRPSK